MTVEVLRTDDVIPVNVDKMLVAGVGLAVIVEFEKLGKIEIVVEDVDAEETVSETAVELAGPWNIVETVVGSVVEFVYGGPAVDSVDELDDGSGNFSTVRVDGLAVIVVGGDVTDTTTV